MIYITGDTHIPVDIQKLSSKRFPQQKDMTKNDYVIICGDFGGVWDNSNEEKYWIKWLKDKKFTTLFIDGNHENFTILEDLPVVDFCGGKVHRVENGIYHLMRGEAYTIENKKIFAFGGASSHDKHHRTENKNWWKAELPSEKEYATALNNLECNNWNFDYILTHCAPDSIQNNISNYEQNDLTQFLETINTKIMYKHWFFGHYHIDRKITDKHTCVFNQIIPLV